MKFWFFLVLCCFAATGAHADLSLNEQYQKASAATGGQRSIQLQAIELELKGQLKSEETPELWVDLAAVLEAENRPVEAFYGIQQALVQRPNFLPATLKARSLSERLNVELPTKTRYQWVKSLPSWVYGAGLLGCYLAGLVAFKKKSSLWTQSATATGFVLFACLLWASPGLFDWGQRWMVMSNQPAFEGPGAEFGQARPLQAGVVIKQAKRQGDWVMIQSENQTFWLTTKNLAPL